jgi:hypothetical protein
MIPILQIHLYSCIYIIWETLPWASHFDKISDVLNFPLSKTLTLNPKREVQHCLEKETQSDSPGIINLFHKYDKTNPNTKLQICIHILFPDLLFSYIFYFF